MKLEGCKGKRPNDIVKPNPMEASTSEMEYQLCLRQRAK